MSNLLTGLAMALGGGLKGYLQGKELQRQQRLEDEERQRRDAMDRRREEVQDLDLAMQGVYREGREPMAGGKIVTPEGRQVLSALTASLGVGGGVPVPGLQGMTDRAGNAFRDRYEQLTPGFRRDVTTTDAYKADEQARQAEGLLNQRTSRVRMARAGNQDALSRLIAEGMSEGALMPDVPKQDWEVETPLGGRAYRVSPGSGRMEYLKDEQGNYVITPRAPREPSQADLDRPAKEKEAFLNEIVAAFDGDWVEIQKQMRQRPHLYEQAKRFGTTWEDWKAAVNLWRAGSSEGRGLQTYNLKNAGNEDLIQAAMQSGMSREDAILFLRAQGKMP